MLLSIMEEREQERAEDLCCAGCSKWTLTLNLKTAAVTCKGFVAKERAICIYLVMSL